VSNALTLITNGTELRQPQQAQQHRVLIWMFKALVISD